MSNVFHVPRYMLAIVLFAGLAIPAWADETPATGQAQISPLQAALTAYEQNPKLDEYRALQAAQKAFAKSGAAPDETSFKAMGILQDLAFANREWRDAWQLGLQRLAAYQALDMTDKNELYDIHMDTGQAYLLSKRKYNLRKAYEQFSEAQQVINNADYLHVSDEFLQARSWQALSSAIMLTRHVPQKKSRQDKTEDVPGKNNYPPKCTEFNKQVKWISRPAPNFPRDAARKGYVGAIILLYDMQPDGSVANVRVGAEAPENMFGQSALDAAKKWVAKLPPGFPIECGRNAITDITYVLRG